MTWRLSSGRFITVTQTNILVMCEDSTRKRQFKALDDELLQRLFLAEARLSMNYQEEQ